MKCCMCGFELEYNYCHLVDRGLVFCSIECLKENYDEKYEGLDKTFYKKEMFEEFAKKVGATCTIIKPQNELYWNNKYVFDCYLSR